jgi:hypothetical protein
MLFFLFFSNVQNILFVCVCWEGYHLLCYLCEKRVYGTKQEMGTFWPNFVILDRKQW